MRINCPPRVTTKPDQFTARLELRNPAESRPRITRMNANFRGIVHSCDSSDSRATDLLWFSSSGRCGLDLREDRLQTRPRFVPRFFVGVGGVRRVFARLHEAVASALVGYGIVFLAGSLH